MIAVLYLALALVLQARVRGDRTHGVRSPMIRQFGLRSMSTIPARGAAGRWLLTRPAFLGGGVVGLVIAVAACVAMSRRCACSVSATSNIVQGMPLLVWLFVLFFGLPIFGVRVSALDRGHGRLLDLCGRLPRRDLARRAAGDPAHAMGGRSLARAELRRAAALHHRPAGGAHRDPADRRLPRAAHQEHFARRRRSASSN